MPGFISNTIQLHVVAYNTFLNDYEFLVLRRSEASPYPLIWQVITGKIENGETALQAALRELNEETSLKPKRLWTIPYIATFFDASCDMICCSPVFGVLVEDKLQLKLSSEHIDFRWLNSEVSTKYCILPSHRQGTNIFWEYILSQKDKSVYEIKSF